MLWFGQISWYQIPRYLDTRYLDTRYLEDSISAYLRWNSHLQMSDALQTTAFKAVNILGLLSRQVLYTAPTNVRMAVYKTLGQPTLKLGICNLKIAQASLNVCKIRPYCLSSKIKERLSRVYYSNPQKANVCTLQSAGIYLFHHLLLNDTRLPTLIYAVDQMSSAHPTINPLCYSSMSCNTNTYLQAS